MHIKTLFELGRTLLLAMAVTALAACGGSGSGSSDGERNRDVVNEDKNGAGDKDKTPPKDKEQDGKDEQPGPKLTGGGPPLEQTFYDVTIESEDGTEIAMTVFQPALEKNQPAPLILFSHGWGGSRSKDLNGAGIDVETARRAWESGYFVITFDQRGFGDSGGQANVQDPYIEGEDIKAILDWAEARLTPHLAGLNGYPRVGGLGMSYGGGFQLIGSSLDPRFDALVPLITWADLNYSLNPNGVPKTGWLTLLTAAGSATGSVAPWVQQSYLEAMVTGETSAETGARLRGHSFASFCSGEREDGLTTPRVDAFFIQGLDDTLFNTNEAVWNHNCLSQAGNDSYLLAQRGGHLLPLMQGNLVGFDETVQCGDKRYRTADLAYGFLDGKLRGLKAKIDMPRVCFVQDDAHGVVDHHVPTGGVRFGVDPKALGVGVPVDVVVDLLRSMRLPLLLNLLQDLGAGALDLVTSVVLGLKDPASLTELVPKILSLLPPETVNEVLAAPHFVPLYTANGTENLAGLPLADLQVQGNADADPRLFVGVGVKRFEADRAVLLHQQVVPMRGVGRQQHELAGISTRLQAGDQVGLMLYGYHPQYAASFSRLPSKVSVRGSVELPLR